MFPVRGEGREDDSYHEGPYFTAPAGEAVEEYEQEYGWYDDPQPRAIAPSRGRRWVREVVETALLAVLVFLTIRASLGTYSVQGHSMDPTLEDGEFLLVNRLQYSRIDLNPLPSFVPFVGDEESPRYLFGAPARGDVVVLHDPRGGDKDLVKRIIGLPGETVEIVRGQVFIDGRLLDEPYITGPWVDSKPRLVVPEGAYYVLGDNRENSSDSRHIGMVKESLLVAKVIGAPWPPSKLGTDFGLEPTLAEAVTRP